MDVGGASTSEQDVASKEMDIVTEKLKVLMGDPDKVLCMCWPCGQLPSWCSCLSQCVALWFGYSLPSLIPSPRVHDLLQVVTMGGILGYAESAVLFSGDPIRLLLYIVVLTAENMDNCHFKKYGTRCILVASAHTYCFLVT